MQKETVASASINSSSLIDLKAELFRKQEEFKNQRLQSQDTSYIKGKSSTATNKKPNIFSKKNAGVAKRSERDYEEKQEEEDVFERSRKALEGKAKLYEKITSGSEIPEEDGSDLYLVDFQKKVIDRKEEKWEKEIQDRVDREKREAEEDRRILEEPAPPAEKEEDEWVDYVDSLGRSRRCLKKDLTGLQQADRKLTGTQGLKKEDTPRDLLSSDMKRQIERQKWEEEEAEQMEKEKDGPIHYANVQHKEIRTHGVGFYQFDKEEAIRQEQMDQLKKLRDETKDERTKRDRIKEKRKAALAARLAKVKHRKREKLGLPDEEEGEAAGSDEEIGPKLSEQSEVQSKAAPEPLTRDDSWRKASDKTREWDRGKQEITERSEKTWLEKQRSERETEFAPPSFYYEESKPDPRRIQTSQKSGFKRPLQEQDTVSEDTSYSDYSDNTAPAEVIDKRDQIVADLILKKLRGYRDDEPVVADGATGYTETTSADIQYTPGMCVEGSLPYSHTQPCTEAASTGQYAMGPFSVPPPPLNVLQQPCCSTFNSGGGTLGDPQVPIPNIHSMPINTSVPPPGVDVPAQDYSIPPPSFTVPPPNMNVPPPNFNVHPQSLTYPPPTYQDHSLDHTVPISQASYSDHSSDHTVPVSQAFQGLHSSAPVYPMDTQQTSAPSQPQSSIQKRIIPKLDIIDTRLMENEGEG